jgi:beta-aspartyl-peptidase (threonine type)
LKVSLIVHGGFADIPTDLIEAHKSGCEASLLEGWEILRSGGRALDAVERAIKSMEDDPAFNAGRGSVLNAEGQIELDASIMEGRDLQAGAVAAVQNVKNPISLARRVLESEHVLLVGAGACSFARRAGMAECSRDQLVVERELRRWQALRKGTAFHPPDTLETTRRGTVGAVAMDRQGDIVAGNSTGGSPFKHPGRVGDSPLVGCGIYADNSLGGVACTGWGESIIRVALAKTAVDLLRGDRPVQEVAALAIQILHERVTGLGGLIMIDRQGRIGHAFNTPAMAYAYVSEDLGQPVVGI